MDFTDYLKLIETRLRTAQSEQNWNDVVKKNEMLKENKND